MKDRIKQIMESQHMTQQVFADFIGMSPASLSSIFNDRTRPTLNIVEAIKKKIPDISTDWLMFGSGTMYQSAAAVQDASDDARQVPSSVHEPVIDFDHPSFPSPHVAVSATQVSTSASRNQNSVRNTRPEIVREEIKFVDKPQRRVTEIRVYYDDQTWESFVPAKKS